MGFALTALSEAAPVGSMRVPSESALGLAATEPKKSYNADGWLPKEAAVACRRQLCSTCRHDDQTGVVAVLGARCLRELRRD